LAIALTRLDADADNKLLGFELPSLSMAGLHRGDQAFRTFEGGRAT
jgi:hypothetical protein